jgi:hypothetical protein
MISVQDRQVSNLEHARWRVAFRQSIYEAHLASVHTGEEWIRKEQEYMQWLKRAKADLYSLEHPRSSPQPPEPRHEVSTPAQGPGLDSRNGTPKDSGAAMR